MDRVPNHIINTAEEPTSEPLRMPVKCRFLDGHQMQYIRYFADETPEYAFLTRCPWQSCTDLNTALGQEPRCTERKALSGDLDARAQQWT